jgi:hypothetical protein
METPIEHAVQLASANGWEVVAFWPLHDSNPKRQTFAVVSNYRNDADPTEDPERTFCTHRLVVHASERPACLFSGSYALTLDEALAEAKEQS